MAAVARIARSNLLKGCALRLFWLSAAQCRGVAQSGSAPALGAGGREFESRRPDHFIFAWSQP